MMFINSDVIKIDPYAEEMLDYNNLIFRASFGKNIDADNTRYAALFLNTLIAGGARKIAVNMTGLEYIDSSGIGVFIGTAKDLRTKNGDIVFLDVPGQIAEIFNVVKLQEFIKIFNSELEAVGFLKNISA